MSDHYVLQHKFATTPILESASDEIDIDAAIIVALAGLDHEGQYVEHRVIDESGNTVEQHIHRLAIRQEKG